MPDARVILYHKHPTSARTRFLKFPYGGVCAFAPLPEGSSLEPGAEESDNVHVHPAGLLRTTEEQLSLASGALEFNSEFQATTRSADGTTTIILARFTSMDPPIEDMAAQDLGFIDLTQARGLPAVELDLLRRAYEVILG